MSALVQLGSGDLCCDFRVQPDGSEEHRAWVWKKMCSMLMHAAIGSTAKRGRWFSLETQTRHQRGMRTANLILLLYVGFQRKFWQKWDETPLLSGTEAANPEAGPEANLEPNPEADPQEEPGRRKMSASSARAELRKRKAEHKSQFRPLICIR